ncbi:hypothetical protein ABFS83_04G165200 [Erythranthe nasuta]
MSVILQIKRSFAQRYTFNCIRKNNWKRVETCSKESIERCISRNLQKRLLPLSQGQQRNYICTGERASLSRINGQVSMNTRTFLCIPFGVTRMSKLIPTELYNPCCKIHLFSFLSYFGGE